MRPQQHGAVSRSVLPQGLNRRAHNEEWRNAPAVKCKLHNLPPGTTTLDIHRNLRRFGNVEHIRIDETRQGDFSRTALVTFKPPPERTAPWDSRLNGIKFVIGDDRPYTVKVFGPITHSFAQNVDSPIRSGLKYPSDMSLHAESIDFGYLERPTSMVIKATRRTSGDDAVKLLLNLKKLELGVHFPIDLKSKGSSTIRYYRFFVALDDEFSLCEVPGSTSTSLIIHLANPPWYSRQLKDAVAMSHATDSHRWSQDDTWFRQTDIVDDKKDYSIIDSSPVSVKKLFNSINIARWTTFRITIKATPGNAHAYAPLRQFLKALQDFNVPIRRNPDLKILQDLTGEPRVWDLLDAKHTSRSLSDQLSAIYLPFHIRYQLEVCISQGWLNEYTLDEAFLHRLAALPPNRAKQSLIHVDSYQRRVYDPMDIFNDLRYSKPVRARPLPSNCVEIHHATVTATGILFHTPSVEITNRIIRKYQRYSDRFLRVRFEDDSYRGQSRLYAATNGKMKLIFEKVRRTMRYGIILGDRHYQFLAWGNSQLREHGAYFFAPIDGITPDSIRTEMGVFEREKVVAKRAARMGQCFSTTRAVSVVSKRAWKKDPIPDIVNGRYTFTDGVGKISQLTAQLVHSHLKLKGPVPSAFQFRLGGCKGVLVIDPDLSGLDIKIRPSQYKFDSTSDELEIIRVSEFWQPFLNRQLILVLSDLGVPDKVFLTKQDDCIEALNRALIDDAAALRALRDNVDPNLMTLSIATMIEDGFRQSNEPFVTSLLRLYRAWTLKYLKEKAKIPVAQGAFVLGVVDETKTLRGHVDNNSKAFQDNKQPFLPEIFMQYTNQHTGKVCIVEGVCIVARNPSLHRGDIRVVRAINVEKLHHMKDVLVMPGTGDRDLPSMCSGGDLDGDDYVVIWDPDLIPKEWNAEPFDYEAPSPVTKEKISTNDIINFFCDYMQNDYLGRIAHAHLAAADFLDDGIRSDQCLELVKLHSMAVDYPKTGVPAAMPRALERTKWPHFMEKKRSGEYRSHKILGKLYDAVERVNFEPNREGVFDQRILSHKVPPPAILDVVSQLKKSYDESMRRIMAQHQIRTEFEVWSTFVLHHSKAARDFKFHEEIGEHAKNLKQQYYDALLVEAKGPEFEKLVPYALAAYHVTHNEVRRFQEKVNNHDAEEEENVEYDPAEAPFISFPWVLQDVLGKIARSTVLNGGASQSSKVETTSEQNQHLKAVLDDFDSAEGNAKWSRIGEHLPDPFVPETPAISAGDRGASEAQAEAEAAPMETKTRKDSDVYSAASLGGSKTLPQLQISTLKSKTRDEQSTSESGSMVSSVISRLSSVESGDTSPEDLHAPASALAPGPTTAAMKGTGSTSGSSHPRSADMSNRDTVGLQVFTDPALMSKDEANANGMPGGSEDEDDFTY
ncbi:hypothetical protein H2202_005963 [Exophiala xenobiotica]|nr:hypothetical protein H2202_005963 [Exophiala xenobiotica]